MMALSKIDLIKIFKHEQNPARQQITALFFSSDKVMQYLFKGPNCRQFTDTKKKNHRENEGLPSIAEFSH